MEAARLPRRELPAQRWTLRFAPDRRQFIQETQTLNTRFQTLHTRLRHIAEPVAFSGGGAAERQTVEAQFDAIYRHQKSILRKEFLYKWVTSLFTGYDMIHIVVQRSIAYNFSLRNNPSFHRPELGASPDLMASILLYERVSSYSQDFFEHITGLFRKLPDLDGRTSRILEMVAALEVLEAADGGAEVPESPHAERGEPGTVEVHSLDLVTPSGACLAQGVTFDVPRGRSLLVTGPSACGKSLLGSVILGVLPPASGELRVGLPRGHTSRKTVWRPPPACLMTAPQRAYLPTGTLGDQVCYPSRHVEHGQVPDAAKEALMLRALEVAGIDYLLTREPKGWHVRRAWADVLSGGEQQRMGLARIFYHRPAYALLDECTHMVAAAAEEGLYRALVGQFDITLLTLTQRLFLGDIHASELRLGARTPEGWALDAIAPSLSPS